MYTETSKQSQLSNTKKVRKTIPIIISICFVLMCQIQPIFVNIIGGLAGSFGVRPTSHLCIGFPLGRDKVKSLFPPGELEFHIGLFHFRYSIPQINHNSAKEFCLGQDIWFGE
ncbi:MAG: hypothetical protein PVF83_16115 [Anaerolineales bacterium]|jgi:hypothetical protein